MRNPVSQLRAWMAKRRATTSVGVFASHFRGRMSARPIPAVRAASVDPTRALNRQRRSTLPHRPLTRAGVRGKPCVCCGLGTRQCPNRERRLSLPTGPVPRARRRVRAHGEHERAPLVPYASARTTSAAHPLRRPPSPRARRRGRTGEKRALRSTSAERRRSAEAESPSPPAGPRARECAGEGVRVCPAAPRPS
jgi:hypothetical protein